MAQVMLRRIQIQILAFIACLASSSTATAWTTRNITLPSEKDASIVSFVQHSVERTSKSNVIIPNAVMSDIDARGPQVATMDRDTSVKGKVQLVELNTREEGRKTHKHIAGPRVIVAMFIILYLPVCIGWLFVIRAGRTPRSLAVMLPFTLCCVVLGLDVINQSLSATMDSPMGLTTIQVFTLFAMMGIYWGGEQVAAPSMPSGWRWPLTKWLVVAVGFTVFQIINHLVSYWCSLSERTVFTNLAPVATLIFEVTVMPKEVQISMSFNRKVALANMVVGAILFSSQYPDFTIKGIGAAILMVLVMIPYRLAQRWFLHDCACLPISLLASVDGLVAVIPPVSEMGAHYKDDFWPTWGSWFATPSVCVLIVLSCLAFTANHVCGLAMLRLGSATNYIVMHNLANVCVVCMGIFLFKDSVAGKPLEVIGIALSLFGGLWYAFDSAQSTPTTTKDGKGKMAAGH